MIALWHLHKNPQIACHLAPCRQSGKTHLAVTRPPKTAPAPAVNLAETPRPSPASPKVSAPSPQTALPKHPAVNLANMHLHHHQHLKEHSKHHPKAAPSPAPQTACLAPYRQSCKSAWHCHLHSPKQHLRQHPNCMP